MSSKTIKIFYNSIGIHRRGKRTLVNLTNRLLADQNRISGDQHHKSVAFAVKCFKSNKVEHLKKDCKMCGICKKTNHKKNVYFKNKNNEWKDEKKLHVAFFSNQSEKKSRRKLKFCG